MNDGAISQDRRFRRSRFEEANIMGLNLMLLWAMLVEMSKATEHRHVWLSEEFWLMREGSFKKEIVVFLPYRDREKEDLQRIHCIWQPEDCW